jgi:hypothetical protein
MMPPVIALRLAGDRCNPSVGYAIGTRYAVNHDPFSSGPLLDDAINPFWQQIYCSSNL